MKVISLRQPWATLYVRGFKKNETRGRNTKHRGHTLVHASAKFDEQDKALCRKHPFNIYIQNPDELPLGAIIGEVEIVAVHKTEDIREKISTTELAFGDYSNGRYAYESINAREFSDPIPARGNVTIPWNYDGPVPESKGVNV